jgi:hypothetical protein
MINSIYNGFDVGISPFISTWSFNTHPFVDMEISYISMEIFFIGSITLYTIDLIDIHESILSKTIYRVYCSLFFGSFRV